MAYNRDSNRRQFLHVCGAGAAAAAAGLVTSVSPRAAAQAPPDAQRKPRPFRLALASYTMHKFSLDETLAVTRTVGLDVICLKSFHLPLELSEEEIKAGAEKVKQAGITLYAGGVITMRRAEEVNQAFEYAKAAGMSKIIGVPALDLLPLVNDKVQQYDIEVCIHNHGPGDKVYPTPDVAYERIKNLDRRIGLCHDIGHTARLGKDPVALSRQCADRLLDVHIKDVTQQTAAGHSIACGRGVINLPALLKTLIQVDYQGYLAFECEENADNPLPELAESVGYIRGVMDML